MEIFLLFIYTLAAWVLHGLFASFYSKKLIPLTSFRFRLTHGLEIGLTTGLMLTIYKNSIDSSLSAWQVLLTILATLIVVDSLLLLFVKQMRHKFDIYHFFIAYIFVTSSVFLIN